MQKIDRSTSSRNRRSRPAVHTAAAGVARTGVPAEREEGVVRTGAEPGVVRTGPVVPSVADHTSVAAAAVGHRRVVARIPAAPSVARRTG